MTRMEKLIRDQVEQSLATTLARVADTIADNMAQEILRDPETRLRFQALIRAAFEHALAGLNRDEPPA